MIIPGFNGDEWNYAYHIYSHNKRRRQINHRLLF